MINNICDCHVTVPEENVATPHHGAQVLCGEMKAALLDGDSQNYDLDRGFTRHPIDDNHGQGICIKLERPCIINTIKMLLWDRDMRFACALSLLPHLKADRILSSHDNYLQYIAMIINIHFHLNLSLSYFVHCVKL